ncbi:MAG: HPF/RaiA family ribosome-associated protein [Acidobacteria bacterium]|nr:HPF/RaiA family ribosome-associated protein [Acidobacteriota bacterium]
MQVLTNTDRNVEGGEGLSAHVEQCVTDAIGRFSDQVTRVEVHLSDENSQKGGADDKRCLMEARLEGQPPMAVSHRAPTIDLALEGAAAKLERAIESDVERRRSS